MTERGSWALRLLVAGLAVAGAIIALDLADSARLVRVLAGYPLGFRPATAEWWQAAAWTALAGAAVALRYPRVAGLFCVASAATGTVGVLAIRDGQGWTQWPFWVLAATPLMIAFWCADIAPMVDKLWRPRSDTTIAIAVAGVVSVAAEGYFALASVGWVMAELDRRAYGTPYPANTMRGATLLWAAAGISLLASAALSRRQAIASFLLIATGAALGILGLVQGIGAVPYDRGPTFESSALAVISIVILAGLAELALTVSSGRRRRRQLA